MQKNIILVVWIKNICIDAILQSLRLLQNLDMNMLNNIQIMPIISMLIYFRGGYGFPIYFRQLWLITLLRALLRNVLCYRVFRFPPPSGRTGVFHVLGVRSIIRQPLHSHIGKAYYRNKTPQHNMLYHFSDKVYPLIPVQGFTIAAVLSERDKHFSLLSQRNSNLAKFH